mmetsp:Transcript_71642/g.133937  ORF Transcript_71642/g.133937 Transcript_71642/m.133937 type:complete len:274 (-) Transcript_71642:71-892(-)
MACKVYAHVEVDGHSAVTLPVSVAKPSDVQFASIKQALLSHHAAHCPNEEPIEYNACCFWNQDSCPIPDKAAVAAWVWEHNDFFLRALPQEADAEGKGALATSQKTRGELSYYYAHDRARTNTLVSKPPSGVTATAPAPPRPKPQFAATGTYNSKQSPFGTDVAKYESITSYTWEDHDDTTVKVLVPLDGVGKLDPGCVRAQFGVRSFELLVDGYNGKNLRFACYKTHAEMLPEECKHIVRANRVNLVLRKAKEKDVWFDLFKKKAIGDDDDP